MTALCVCCERPMPDHAYACVACSSKTAGQLRAIIDLAPDARLVAAGLVRRGRGGDGGKPGSQSPLNDGATDALSEVQNTLTTLARDIAETRGLVLPDAGGRDPIVVAARWLLGQVEWLRHAAEDGQPWAPGSYAEISDCAGRMRGIVNGPSEQRFLGPCGAVELLDIGTLDEPGRTMDGQPCTGDVYGTRGAQIGRCRACGAEVAQDDREAWLDGEVRSHAFRAAHIAQAYGVNVNTIRTWAARPRPDTGVPPLASYWRTSGGLITPWVEPVVDGKLTGEARKQREAEVAAEIEARGPRLHYVGDVLDLAAADAARRAEEQAKRARRAAAREAATSEGDAA